MAAPIPPDTPIAPLGGTVRRGRWRVPARSVEVALIGGASAHTSRRP